MHQMRQGSGIGLPGGRSIAGRASVDNASAINSIPPSNKEAGSSSSRPGPLHFRYAHAISPVGAQTLQEAERLRRLRVLSEIMSSSSSRQPVSSGPELNLVNVATSPPASLASQPDLYAASQGPSQASMSPAQSQPLRVLDQRELGQHMLDAQDRKKKMET